MVPFTVSILTEHKYMSNPLTVRQFVKYEYEVDRYSTAGMHTCLWKDLNCLLVVYVRMLTNMHTSCRNPTEACTDGGAWIHWRRHSSSFVPYPLRKHFEMEHCVTHHWKNWKRAYRACDQNVKLKISIIRIHILLRVHACQYNSSSKCNVQWISTSCKRSSTQKGLLKKE